MSPGQEIHSIAMSSYQFQGTQGENMSGKSAPVPILLPGQQVDDIGRVLWTWNSRKDYTSGTVIIEPILGFHAQRVTAGTIAGLTSTRISMTGANGMHCWIQVTAVVDVTLALRIHGDSIDECGTITATDTEDIVIDSTVDKVYCSTKRWIGTLSLRSATEGVTPQLSITANAGVVDPWSLGRALRVLQAVSFKWRPNAATWRVDFDANYFVPGDTTTGAGGLLPVNSTGPAFPRTFRDTDTPTRAQNGVMGEDYDSQLDQVIDPMLNEGFVVRLGLRNVDLAEFWASFYRY